MLSLSYVYTKNLPKNLNIKACSERFRAISDDLEFKDGRQSSFTHNGLPPLINQAGYVTGGKDAY